MTAIPAVWMRGGTSKGVFLLTRDLPAAARLPGPARDALLLRLLGSPDPFSTQIDGLGGATPSTSKAILVEPATQPGCDLAYWFGAVGIDRPLVDWGNNCGNLTAAVAPFAIRAGLVRAPAEGVATVRMWQGNTAKVILAHVPMRGGLPQEEGGFMLDGVAFPSAEIRLEFLDPGADPESGSGPLFPTGQVQDRLEVPGLGTVAATQLTAGAPTVFVRAADFGLTGRELRADIDAHDAARSALVAARRAAAVRMGLCATPEEADARVPHAPRIVFVAPPAAYTSSSGKQVGQGEVDLLARVMTLGRLHHAMTGTGAVALAVAAAVPGTVVAEAVPAGPGGRVRFGHPSGTLAVGADVVQDAQGGWAVSRVAMSRSARRLMAGEAFVPDEPACA